jgi:hypothetical protein
VTLATSREPAFKAKLMLPNMPQGMLMRVEKLEKATLGGLRMPSAEACLVQMLCVCVCVCVSACVSVAVSVSVCMCFPSHSALNVRGHPRVGTLNLAN